jgi:protein-disulfide isomerase
MKLKNIFFIISFIGIFNITYAGWFDDDEKNKEIEDLKAKQIVIEKKINQLDKKIDAVLKAIGSINTASKNTDKPKPQNKRKPSDPSYVHKIDQGNSMFIGNPDAKVTVTEFFDFQ